MYQTDVWSVQYIHDHSHCTGYNSSKRRKFVGPSAREPQVWQKYDGVPGNVPGQLSRCGFSKLSKTMFDLACTTKPEVSDSQIIFFETNQRWFFLAIYQKDVVTKQQLGLLSYLRNRDCLFGRGFITSRTVVGT